MAEPNRAPVVTVGIDGSDCARAALKWAADWTSRRGGELLLVGAEAIPGRLLNMKSELVAQAQHELHAERTRILEEFPGLRVEIRVVVSHPTRALVKASGESDLLVVGSRGRSRVLDAVIGNVAETVSALAHCPVVVVPDRAEVNPSGPVVLAADGSVESRAAAEFAFDYAHQHQVDVEAIHVWQDPGAPTWALAPAVPLSTREFDPEAEGAEIIDTTIADASAAYPGVTVHRVVESGPAGDVLAARSMNCSLLALGSRGRGDVAAFVLGSVSRSALHRAMCPVAVVRVPDDED